MLDIGDIVFIILFTPVIGLVLAALIINAINRKKIRRILTDERLKNAKIFNKSDQLVAISPDGFIGTIDVLEPKIIHIKNITSFQITFDDEIIKSVSGGLIFDGINESVQSYLKKKIDNIYLMLNINDNSDLKINLLHRNVYKNKSISKPNTYNKRGINDFKQNEIKQLLNAFEEIEKYIKEDK